MSASLIAALCFTGAWLVTTTYFVMGSVPLLILEHDTPMDARFVGGFFNTYYLAALFTAGATALSYAVAGRWGFAAGAAGLALLAATLHRTVIPKMASLGAQIEVVGKTAITAFRRLHGAVILINPVQLVPMVWSLIVVSRQ